MSAFWVYMSGFAIGVAALCLLISAGLIMSLINGLLPLLGDTREQVQDLGDLAANTVGRASDTMDLVELRVSQAMGQAADAGSQITRQALGVGSALAGVYIVARIAQTVRGYVGAPKRRRARRR